MDRRDSTFASRDQQSRAKYNKKIANIYVRQKKDVLAYLNRVKIPQCMREIEIGTGVPVYIICRVLAEFERRKIVEVKFIGESRISGFPNVKYYGLVPTLFQKGGTDGL